MDKGYDLSRYTWMFDGLKCNGGKWDVIGMSLYPDSTTWKDETTECLSNMKTLVERYNCKVMVCETGMSWDDANAGNFMTTLVSGAKDVDGCLGVFYWEPECYGGWQGYTKGAFNDQGYATSVLDVFKDK